MDEYDKVQNMRLRMAALKDVVGKAMMQTANFSVALHDELRSDDIFGPDTQADFVADALHAHNATLAIIYEDLFNLEAQLY